MLVDYKAHGSDVVTETTVIYQQDHAKVCQRL